MSKYSNILFFLFTTQLCVAQVFNFESTLVPTAWVAAKGTLSVSTEHFKEGTKSLKWETVGTSVLNVAFADFAANNSNSAFFQIYNSVQLNDTLKVEFLFNSTVKRTAVFLCNYSGWREFNRAYTEYAFTQSTTINGVRFTLKPTSTNSRSIYFDNVILNSTTESNRIVGSQWKLDSDYSLGSKTQLEMFKNSADINVNTPSTNELADLTQLRTLLKRTPTAGNTTTLNAAKTYVQSLNIVRNSDGTVQGNTINTTAAGLTDDFMTDISRKAEILAEAGLTDPATLTLFRNFIDHLLDQGIAEGCNFELFSNVYTPCETIPTSFLNTLPACTDTQKSEVLKLVRWISFYGRLYDSPSTYLSKLNSDVVYLFLPHIMAVAVFQTDDAVAVRELKAFKRFLERNSEYTPGASDFLKPDGTGFHHKTHYNHYMYAYSTYAEYLYYLKGTSYKVSATAFDRFKKAIISLYTMGTLSTGNERYTANSLCGRDPFNAGIKINFSKALFEKLIEASGDARYEIVDNELASAYNYFFKTDKYSVDTISYDGFHQFNYSPMGIFRKNNWVATMRAPTANFWGAEIYDNQNRFGRYQSHGSLEITYAGTQTNSGFPSSGTGGGGWDWNVVPGTTTVHYSSWQDMMPLQSTIGRFDQYSKSTNFAGALASGNCGMFAADFDQSDTWWVNNAFIPTNLTFKKSVFAFDSILIAMGSNIGSSGTYSTDRITATNLFQGIKYPFSGNLILNGTTLSKPYELALSSAVDNWIITPQGTGYIIPKGNDPLFLSYVSQTTPVESGADYAHPTTTAEVAKAYLNHGVKTSDKAYSFVVVPGTTTTQMQLLALQMANNGGSVFEIHAQNSGLHALTYKPLNVTAYSFFGAVNNLNFGIIKSSSAENLLMCKRNETQNQYSFAICNPNLNPQSNSTYGWLPTSTQTTLTLNGEWLPLSPVVGVYFNQPVNEQTQVTVTFKNGEPLYFAIRNSKDTNDLSQNKEKDWLTFTNDSAEIHLNFPFELTEKLTIAIYTADGRIIENIESEKGVTSVNIPIIHLSEGAYLCKIANSIQSKTIKFLK